MLFPFRASTIFRNRWVALLWAVGICFTASEIVDSLSGVAGGNRKDAAVAPAAGVASHVPATIARGNAPPPPFAAAPIEDHIAR